MLSFLLVVALLGSRATAMDEAESERARLALQNPDLFEGDVLGIDPHERNVIPGNHMRWSNGVIPYVIDQSLGGYTSLIQSGMQDYHSRTCLRFVPRTNQHVNYIKIFAGQGCYSYIGMINRGEQPLSLGQGCLYRGTVVHELGHAIGFFHEQARSDRDDYLIIYWNNIQQGMADQFAKLSPQQNILYNAFDHSSIMLYGNFAFTKQRGQMTMVARNGAPLKEPYERQGMTQSDVVRVNRMYNCQ